MDWTEFDAKINDETMSKLNDLEAGKKVDGDYPEVPHGKYEVVPEKVEAKVSKNGNPMTVIWFRIVAGPMKGSMIFANLVMKSSFGIHRAKQFIKSLEPDTPVHFESFTQWEEYLMEVGAELNGQVSYVLDYSYDTNKKGETFDKWTIEDGPFEVPSDYTAPDY